jgi:hypothetical protein
MTTKSSVVQVILSAKDQNLVSEMVKAEMATQRLGKAAKDQDGAFQQMSKSLGAVTSAVTGFVGYQIGKDVVGLIQQQVEWAKQYVKSGMDAADALQRQAKNLGIATNAMAAFLVMEQRADLASGSFANALIKMQQSINDAATLGSSADLAFRKLGIRFSDLIGLSADQQFRMIADAVSKMDNAVERTSTTVDIFGKAGKEMVGVLREGSKVFDEATDAANRYGIALTAEQEARLSKLDDVIKQQNLIMEGYKKQVASAVAAEMAASAKYDELAAKKEAQLAQDAAAQVGWWTMFKARIRDAIDSANYNVDEWGNTIGKSKEVSTEWADAVQGAANEVVAAGKMVSSATAKTAVEQQAAIDKTIATHQKEVAEIKRKHDIQASYGSMLRDMSKANDAIDQKRIKDLKKAIDSLRGSYEVVNKFQSDMYEAGKKYAVLGNPEDDPRVKREREINKIIMDDKRMATLEEANAEVARREQYTSIRDSTTATDKQKRQAYNEEVKRLEKQEGENRLTYQKQRAEREKLATIGAYQNIADSVVSITSSMSDKSRELFYIDKAAKIAQALMNSWMAYSNTLASPIGTINPQLAQAAATTQLTAGFFAASQIAAQEPPGRANGGPVSRGGVYQVNERGPEMLSIGDKSFLMMNGKNGNVQTIGPGGAPRVTVNVTNMAPGTQARAEQGGTEQEPRIEVIIERVEGAIANGIARGTSAVSRAIQGTYGLNRARGAT